MFDSWKCGTRKTFIVGKTPGEFWNYFHSCCNTKKAFGILTATFSARLNPCCHVYCCNLHLYLQWVVSINLSSYILDRFLPKIPCGCKTHRCIFCRHKGSQATGNLLLNVWFSYEVKNTCWLPFLHLPPKQMFEWHHSPDCFAVKPRVCHGVRDIIQNTGGYTWNQNPYKIMRIMGLVLQTLPQMFSLKEVTQ